MILICPYSYLSKNKFVHIQTWYVLAPQGQVPGFAVVKASNWVLDMQYGALNDAELNDFQVCLQPLS